MATELRVPPVGESITEGVIAEWLKQVGDHFEADEPLVVIETDKVNVELPAPAAGTLTKILKAAGETVAIDEVVGEMEAGAAPAAKSAAEPAPKSEPKAEATATEKVAMPAASKEMAQKGIDPASVEGTGKGGRILKEDVAKAAEAPAAKPAPTPAPKPTATTAPAPSGGSREERAVKMTPLRKRVAERLVESQHNAALLTTFNEIDMSAVMELRKRHQDSFVATHGIKLGFMSFFVKAVIEGLKQVPELNAEIRGEEIVYRNYYDIGIAVGGGKGLVVPIVRNAERLSFAETEKAIAALAEKAKKSTLTLEELQGGTFTITNGGIYGSLLSTPIVNPPQSGILGMHKIEDRPVAIAGQVVIRPMMYVAVTYDHRLIDGREAVTFLVKVKERLEDPTRILLEV